MRILPFLLPATADNSPSTSSALANIASNSSTIYQEEFLQNFPTQPVFMNPSVYEGNQVFGQSGNVSHNEQRCINESYNHSNLLDNNKKPSIYQGTF